MFILFTLLFAAAATMIGLAAPVQAHDLKVRNGYVDGTGWEGLYGVLRREGFHVGLIQRPGTRSRLPAVSQTTRGCCA